MTNQQVINILAVAVLTFIIEALLFIWSLNTLFNVDIQHDMASFFAALFIVYMIKPSKK